MKKPNQWCTPCCSDQKVGNAEHLANWCIISTCSLHVPFEHTPQKSKCWAQASVDLLASPGCWLSHSLQQQALGQCNSLVAFCCPFSKRFVPPDMTESLNLPGSQFLYTVSCSCVLSHWQHEVLSPSVEMLQGNCVFQQWGVWSYN